MSPPPVFSLLLATGGGSGLATEEETIIIHMISRNSEDEILSEKILIRACSSKYSYIDNCDVKKISHTPSLPS